RFKHKDGSWRILEAVGNNICDENGHTRIVINSRDITERKRAEERYRILIQTARDGVVTLDADGIITSLNPAFEAISGAPAAHSVRKPLTAALHPDDVPLAQSML